MIKVYACGGAGVNVGKSILPANADVCYVDTSKSNTKNIPAEKVFLVDGMDGAGKHQKTTYDTFKGIDENVLIKHKPSEELNIVISSFSGGSGSIIGAMLARNLAMNDKNVIVIGIVTSTSLIEINNSIKTLENYKGISSKISRCMSLLMYNNQIGRDAVDRKIVQAVNLFSLIVDKTKTEEFDVSDLKNFINFNNVTNNQPTASIISTSEKNESCESKGEHTVASIHVTYDKNTTITDNIPEYLATCILTEKSAEGIDVRIDNTIGGVDNEIDALRGIAKKIEENKKIKSIKEKQIDAGDDGFTF